MVLNASALPLRHSDLQCFVQFINHREEIKYNRSEWCSGRAQAFKTIGHGFAPRQRFVFFTRRRRRRVSIYQSYIGGLPPASAFSFSHVDVGDAFQFINHISANPYRPAVLSFCADLYSGFSYKFVFLIPGHGWTESSGSLR